jgi:tryptophan synthase alpha chain
MIAATFAKLRERGEGALVPFVTAGDPDLRQLPSILTALAEAGADMVEVGIPFSDPIADGPTIQASSQRALDKGVTPDAVLGALADTRLSIPVVLMGYLNPMLRMGLARFAARARQAGAAGVIVSDLTPEEADEWRAAAQDEGLDTVFLAAPTSTDARLAAVAAASTGFVYAVSRTGVTGHGNEAPPEVADLVHRLRAHTGLPICVGFGISAPDHVARVCQAADGAVVGSWLVDVLWRTWRDGAGRDEVVAAVRALKDSTRR